MTGSCGPGKSHPRKPLLKPRIAAQTVPLRRHGEMYERRVAAVERAIEAAECVVKIAGLGMQHREPDVGAAAGVLRPFCGALESASCHRCVSAARVRRLQASAGGAYLLDRRRWRSERLGLRDVLLQKRVEVAGRQVRAGQELAREQVLRIGLTVGVYLFNRSESSPGANCWRNRAAAS